MVRHQGNDSERNDDYRLRLVQEERGQDSGRAKQVITVLTLFLSGTVAGTVGGAYASGMRIGSVVTKLEEHETRQVHEMNKLVNVPEDIATIKNDIAWIKQSMQQQKSKP